MSSSFFEIAKFVKLVKLVWLVKGCDQERNKMKLKGADLEHEQHEALVQHFQVMTLFVICFHTKISNEVNKNWVLDKAGGRMYSTDMIVCIIQKKADKEPYDHEVMKAWQVIC